MRGQDLFRSLVTAPVWLYLMMEQFCSNTTSWLVDKTWSDRCLLCRCVDLRRYSHLYGIVNADNKQNAKIYRVLKWRKMYGEILLINRRKQKIEIESSTKLQVSLVSCCHRLVELHKAESWKKVARKVYKASCKVEEAAIFLLYDCLFSVLPPVICLEILWNNI